MNELAPYLPKGFPVYILFDSWYASNKLIKFCRRRGWHVICAVKSNRIFQGKRLSKLARYLRNKAFTPTWVGPTDSETLYWVCVREGHLRGLRDEVKIFISKRHPRDRTPEFFLCTDTSLSARQGLGYYSQRWAVEVDHLYLKTRLGLEDFRLRSVEEIKKYLSLTFLTLSYLHWRKFEERAKTLREVIALHRRQQWQQTLKNFGQQILKYGEVEPVLSRFLTGIA